MQSVTQKFWEDDVSEELGKTEAGDGLVSV